MSRINDWISDLFCRAVTGGGFSKRVLFSHDDDYIYSFKRCIGFNEYDQEYLDRYGLVIGMAGKPIKRYLAEIEKKLGKPMSTLYP